MVLVQTTASKGDFQLGEWLVQPMLNRISRSGTVVQIEPKHMDLLVFLAEHPDEVVSKDAIADAVWKQKFYSEWVITRAVAALRRALEDDAKTPKYIETITKRGYRVVAKVVATATPVAAAAVTPAVVAPAVTVRSAQGPSFVVGQWVRGERFYGRTALIEEILNGPRSCLWVLGSRAIGKTSLLRQIEHITANSQNLGWFPIYLDLQGASDTEGLFNDLHNALQEAEDRLIANGIALADVEEKDFFTTIARLRRTLAVRGARLILLCDEAEELIGLSKNDPAALRKLRRTMQASEDMRCILTASTRLWALAEQGGDTSPFLHGFVPPEVIGPLADEEAWALLLQTQTPSTREVLFTDEIVTQISKTTGKHPYFLQMLAKQTLQSGDLMRACQEVVGDPAVMRLCAADMSLLAEPERAMLRLVHEHKPKKKALDAMLAADSSLSSSSLATLERMGFIRHDENDCTTIANCFFLRFLTAQAVTK